MKVSPNSDTPEGKPCGVYAILCLSNNKVYVGSAVNIPSRWSVHRWGLRANRHHCGYLQRAWNKYGERRFKFVVVEYCEENKLAEREQYYMDVSRRRLMNSQPVARCSRGYKHSAETKRRMSQSAIKVASSAEQRKIRSERAKRMHAEGKIPARPMVHRSKTCCVCFNEFTPRRLPNGIPSGTKYCDDCRPEHKGGYYKTAPR